MGGGAWGSAVSGLFRENKHNVSFWKRGEKLPEKAIVFSAIPTQYIRESLLPSAKVSNITFINGAKGVERGTHLLPYQIVQEILPDVKYLTLIGPSFAAEVKKKMPTLVNLGHHDKLLAERVKKLIQTPYFRVKLTKSIRSLELASAFKNIYAISCGIAEGLGYKVNTRTKLILLAIEEFNLLREKLGYKIDSKALPATIGDLVLTCSSKESRNFTFGKLLATKNPSESLMQVKETVEGYYTTESIPFFEESTNISLPLAHFVYEVCYQKHVQVREKLLQVVSQT